MVYTHTHVIVASHNISNLMNQMQSLKLLNQVKVEKANNANI